MDMSLVRRCSLDSSPGLLRCAEFEAPPQAGADASQVRLGPLSTKERSATIAPTKTTTFGNRETNLGGDTWASQT